MPTTAGPAARLLPATTTKVTGNRASRPTTLKDCLPSQNMHNLRKHERAHE